MTICATTNGFLLVDTHIHNDRGFIMAFSGASDRSDLENWLHRVCITDWDLKHDLNCDFAEVRFR